MTIATPHQTAAVDQLIAALDELTAIDRYAILGMFQIMVDSTDPELQRVHLALLAIANLAMASA